MQLVASGAAASCAAMLCRLSSPHRSSVLALRLRLQVLPRLGMKVWPYRKRATMKGIREGLEVRYYGCLVLQEQAALSACLQARC